ncbi:MAG: hypothetical protein LBR11_01875 [Deltaproteobacteria bacterium]|nr:hypothetical protein [Deltaproteobacteria bacterium]
MFQNWRVELALSPDSGDLADGGIDQFLDQDRLLALRDITKKITTVHLGLRLKNLSISPWSSMIPAPTLKLSLTQASLRPRTGTKKARLWHEGPLLSLFGRAIFAWVGRGVAVTSSWW